MGIKLIDDQHKELLNLVNEFLSHSSGNEADEQVYFKSVIDHAVNYIKTHFATEEKIMLATKFPEYDEHKKEHEKFVLTVVKTAKEYDAGKRMVLRNFANFLKEWVLTHVAIVDVKYSHYFKKIATRKEDGSLSISAEDILKASD